jgi:hypothetical protein
MPYDPDDGVVPFPNSGAQPPGFSRCSTIIAVVITIVSGIVELGKWAMLLGVMVLAGFGLATLLR